MKKKQKKHLYYTEAETITIKYVILKNNEILQHILN